jgi:aspartyl protease family protein
MAGRWMIKFAMIGLVGALAAAASAKAVLVYGHADSDLRPAQVATDDAATGPAKGSDAQVNKGADGHYWAEAAVNGRAVRLLVDTGATAVALTATDAKRLGFDPKALDYNYRVATASGQARAARIRLASVSVAGAEVENVDALVIDRGLQTSLLGMTYLGRLSQFEATPTALILRP